MAVMRHDHHVRFGLSGRDGADFFQLMGIEHVQGLVEFSRNIEHAVGPKLYPVRAHGTDSNAAHDGLLVQVNDFYRAAIGPGFSNARVSVDWQVSQTSVARSGHLVGAYRFGFHFANLNAGLRIYQAHALVAL